MPVRKNRECFEGWGSGNRMGLSPHPLANIGRGGLPGSLGGDEKVETFRATPLRDRLPFDLFSVRLGDFCYTGGGLSRG